MRTHTCATRSPAEKRAEIIRLSQREERNIDATDWTITKCQPESDNNSLPAGRKIRTRLERGGTTMPNPSVAGPKRGLERTHNQKLYGQNLPEVTPQTQADSCMCSSRLGGGNSRWRLTISVGGSSNHEHACATRSPGLDHYQVSTRE